MAESTTALRANVIMFTRAEMTELITALDEVHSDLECLAEDAQQAHMPVTAGRLDGITVKLGQVCDAITTRTYGAL